MFEQKNDSEILEKAFIELKKKERKKKIIIVSILAILTIGILTGLWGLGYSHANKKASVRIEELERKIKKLEDTPVVLHPITPEIVLNTLSEKTKDASELVTAEYIFTNAARFTNTKHIAILPKSWTQKSFVQKWDGVIKAGIKLEQIKVAVEKKKITIKLPSADIISYEIDNDTVEILDEKNNLFNRITVKDKVNFDKETAYEMKARAVKNGLLTKAQENAEEIIENIIRTGIGNIKNSQNIQEYIIVFETID